MQITHNGKTYKWTSDTFGTLFINEDFTLYIREDGTIQLLERERYGYPTYHTPEQLVKLGYMELITKPEEKPTEECECKGWRQIHRKDGYLFCVICDKRIIENHDKAMEIPEVPDFMAELSERCFSPEGLKTLGYKQLELLTTSLNLLIKAHNNK